METIFKDEQVSLISKQLGIPKVQVNKIITTYVHYLRCKLDSGETIKFLNICYLKYEGKDEEVHETLAYVSHEVGEVIGQSQVVVYRVLTTFEETLIKELKKLNSFSVRGLIRIKLEKNYKGDYKVRTKKSTVYNNEDIYVTTLGSFKRRVEVVS